jgi:AcrR family transcriptional regulator
LRRAQILAAIRALLFRQGLEGVTMRRIAQEADLSVQSIYNLVGPRDEAIAEAISEYTRAIGLTPTPDPGDPDAVMQVIGRWIGSVEDAPEFCRQVCLIFFSPSRHIFYQFRDKQLKALQYLLIQQQRARLIRPEVQVRDLAEELIMFASALCVEWSDRPFGVDQLLTRLRNGFVNLMSRSMEPGVIRYWLERHGPQLATW